MRNRARSDSGIPVGADGARQMSEALAALAAQRAAPNSHHLDRVVEDPDKWVPKVEDPMELYAMGLDFAAEVTHAEARWQTELARRAAADPDLAAQHRYAAERASQVEAAIRGVAACSRPSTVARS